MLDPARTRQALVIRNRVAAFGWGLMAVWLGMLMLFTWIMARDGPHPSQPAWLQHGVLGLFWLVGVPAAAHVMSLPVTRLGVRPDGSVLLQCRTPFRRAEEVFPAGTVAEVRIREGRDSDGDPYWRTFLVATDGRERLVREGHDAEGQADIAERLREALGLPARAGMATGPGGA